MRRRYSTGGCFVVRGKRDQKRVVEEPGVISSSRREITARAGRVLVVFVAGLAWSGRDDAAFSALAFSAIGIR